MPLFGLQPGFLAPITLVSQSVVRDIWGIFILELQLVPVQFRERQLCHKDDVDAPWDVWCKEAEAGLMRAYLSAGSLPLTGNA